MTRSGHFYPVFKEAMVSVLTQQLANGNTALARVSHVHVYRVTSQLPFRMSYEALLL